MEESSIKEFIMADVIYPIIKNPHFTNPSMTKIRLTLVNESGTSSTAELTIPADRKPGTNKMWDRIAAEFDVSKMEEDLKFRLGQVERQRKFQAEKEQAAKENEKLRFLFAQKVEALKLPFVKNGKEEYKKLIRKSPDMFTLNFVIYKIAEDHMKENSMEISDFIEMIEDSLYE